MAEQTMRHLIELLAAFALITGTCIILWVSLCSYYLSYLNFLSGVLTNAVV